MRSHGHERILVWAALVGFLCCSTALSAPPSTHNAHLPTSFVLRTYQDEDGPHRYAVYLPNGQPPEQGWPIVLFLHGAGECGTDGIAPLSVGLGTALEASPQPFVAVFPQSNNLSQRYLHGWEASGKNAQRALKILEEVERTEQVDTSRRALCGWSMGGYGAWSLAAKYPEKWSAVLAISGGAEEQLDLTNLAKAQTEVLVVHGGDDKLIPLEQSTRLYSDLRNAGGRTDFRAYELGHDVWRKVLAIPDVLKWLADPTSVRLYDLNAGHEKLLPPRSRFYTEHYSHVTTIQDALSIRLGNDALVALSQEALTTIPETALQGDLEDIYRSLSSGDQNFEVTLRDLRWSCQLAKCKLQGIHSGRFAIDLALRPIELVIGETQLASSEHSATLGTFKIVIGHLEPVHLQLEVQPSMVNGELKLLPLRQTFRIADHNWYIQHPTEVTVNSDSFTKYHVRTGVIGSLYKQRSELERQVLNVVPTLLGFLEDQLQQQDAPQLAKFLWPLPVLVPEVQLAPSQVRTDRNGVSLVLNVLTSTYGVGGEPALHTLPRPFQVREMEQQPNLTATVALPVVEHISSAITAGQVAQINILDFPDDQFIELCDPNTIKTLFPNLPANHTVEALLQLNGPFSLSQSTRDPNRLQLAAPAVSVEYLSRTKDGELDSLGAFHFSLQQDIALDLSKQENGAQLQTDWNTPVVMGGIHFEGRRQTPDNNCNKAFRKSFVTAWTKWSKQQSYSQPVPTLTHGPHPLSLDTITTDVEQLELEYKIK